MKHLHPQCNRVMLLIFFLSFFLAIPAVYSQKSEKQPVRLKIMTFNILHGATMKGDFDLDLIARVIKEAGPDLVALQEVDFRTRRANGMDLVLELAHRTGMIPLFGKAMDYDGGAYGEGILSKTPIEASMVYPLDATPEHEPRAALMVKISLSNGEKIAFIGTHLDHTDDPSDRIAQAMQLNTLLREIEVPVILAGDLNAIPGSVPIELLTDKWTMAAGNNASPTYPSANPSRKIDYVFFHPQNRWKVLETTVLDEKIASDHRPYLVLIELLPE